MKLIKTIAVSLMAVAICVTMTACMNNGTVSKPQATVETNYMPEASATNPVTGTTQAPVAFDWVTGSGTIESNINRISEIADNRVVVTGTTALVGVRFTSAYQGEMTERIREMIASEVLKADNSIQTVAVTAEQADVDQIFTISEELRTGKPADQVATKINEIVRNATTLR